MKNKPPSPTEVAAEIATLKELLPKVRRWTFFKEDNHEAIQVQIGVLEDELDEDGCYICYAEEAFEDHSEFDERILNVALDAARWLEGSDKEKPSEGWQELVDA